MKRLRRFTLVCLLLAAGWQGAHAAGPQPGSSDRTDRNDQTDQTDQTDRTNRSNRGNDPFVRISQAIADCPEPLGPLETEGEWIGDAHYRIERGNSCWVEGRCRLSNAYLYDKEIAESVQRRLLTISYATHWRDQTSLWLTMQRRFIYVQGCVGKDFDTGKFMQELGKTADVDRVIDETTADPHAAKLPYRTKQDPDRPTSEPGE